MIFRPPSTRRLKYIFAFARAHTHTHTHTHAQTLSNTRTQSHTLPHSYIYIYIYTHNHIYMWACVCKYIYIYIYICILAERLEYSTIGSRDRGSIPGGVIPKTQKMVLDASLRINRHYKAWINGRLSNQLIGVAPPPTSRCSSVWKVNLRVTLDFGRPTYMYM